MLNSITSNQDIVTITLEGSIDSSNAREFQKQVAAQLDTFDIIDGIIIDANELTFLSSMGMRTLLWLKKEYEEVTMIGVSQQVYNVLKMTGFNKILTVEMALQQMSAKGLKPMPGPKGVYELSADQALKVFPPEVEKLEVDREVALAKTLFVMGVPTTMAFEIVRVDEGYGLIYEKIQGGPVRNATVIGAELRKIHAMEVDPEQHIPSVHIALKRRISELTPYLGEKAVKKLQYMVNTVPETYLLSVGFPTLDTLLFQDGELIICDMQTVGFANPALDMAHLYATLPKELKGDFYNDLLKAYLQKDNPEDFVKEREIYQTLAKVFDYTRLLENGEPDEDTIARYQQQFEEQIVACWDEVLSRLRFKMDFHSEIRKLEHDLFFLKSDIDVDWVAQTIGTNRHYVSDYFNKVLHTTFNNYLSNLRLDYAYKLISSGQVKSTQVAFKCGFNSEHTFRRAFKQRFGCTPSNFDKKQ